MPAVLIGCPYDDWFVPTGHDVDRPEELQELTRTSDHAPVPISTVHRIHVTIDCECGTTVEGCNDEELLDELLEHIAAVHEREGNRGPRPHPSDSMPFPRSRRVTPVPSGSD